VGSCSTKVGSSSHFSLRNWHLESHALIYRTRLGSITYLSFPTRSHLLSASDDGTICLYHTRDWALLTTLRGHKERVNSVAIHSSMKVGLSVGKDRTLRMWDLMRGKGSASMKLGRGEMSLSLLFCCLLNGCSEGEVIRWTPSGTRFAVASQTSIDIYSTVCNLPDHSIFTTSYIH
jgi:protein MAK11